MKMPGVNLYKLWNVFGHRPKSELWSSPNPAYHYTTRVKWTILCIVFFVQISMNFNASVFPNAVTGISHEFNVPPSAVMLGQMIFLFTYAIGCEAWAPWSEELGRKWVLQTSLACVNLWQLLGGLAPNLATIIVGRALGGLSSAGGSVTLGIVADMWASEDHQYAVNFIVLGSVLGGVTGPIAGGFMEKYLNWRWNFWMQLIIGVTAQLLQLTLPETERIVVLRDEPKWNSNATEIRAPPREKMTLKSVTAIWMRPFKMFVCEPIVLLLSLLSGFADALIFTCLESFKTVFSQWGYDSVGVGLSFVPIAIGYFIAYISFLYPIHRFRAMSRAGQVVKPESRLWWLMYTAPLLPLGLFGFAFTSGGPSVINTPFAAHVFSALIGIANFAVYMATIDYMVAAYGRYSASATGGNGMARDLLAGISAIYAHPLFSSVGPQEYHLRNASLILGCVSVVFVAPVYIFYFYGPWIRSRSPFALEIEEDRLVDDVRAGKLPTERLHDLKQIPIPADLVMMMQKEQNTPGSPPIPCQRLYSGMTQMTSPESIMTKEGTLNSNSPPQVPQMGHAPEGSTPSSLEAFHHTSSHHHQK